MSKNNAHLTEFLCVIHRHPEAKGNARRIGRIGKSGRIISRKSKNAEEFMMQAILEIQQQAAGRTFRPEAKLGLRCSVQYPDYRHDLDISLVMDALECAGVIWNDRQIREIVATAADNKGSFTTVLVQDIGELPWKPTSKRRQP